MERLLDGFCYLAAIWASTKPSERSVPECASAQLTLDRDSPVCVCRTLVLK